jgi:hypothetical protein
MPFAAFRRKRTDGFHVPSCVEIDKRIESNSDSPRSATAAPAKRAQHCR